MIPSGFEPGSTCTLQTIEAAILTAWPTVERCGVLWGTYTVATILPISPKKEEIFRPFADGFLHTCQDFIIILTKIYFTTLWEEKRGEVCTLSPPPQNNNNNN